MILSIFWKNNKMKLNFILLAILLAVYSTSAMAKIEYYPDPVYKKLGVEDNHPMDEVYNLAKSGDIRAQFIIGDLYSKGKGGIYKNLDKAKKWFQKAALQGHYYSFIRLAAIAKHENKNIEAWKWYSLAIKNLDYGEKRDFVLKARKELVKNSKLSRLDIKKAEKLITMWNKEKKKNIYNKKIAAFKLASKTNNKENNKENN